MIPRFALIAFIENPAMLGWLAAASAPLIIHLLNRRKFRESSWAAMQFLLAAVRKNSRRVQIEQWLLLALRTLLIVLFVLAAAQPGLKSIGLSTPTAERTHRVLVVDGSFSMDYKPTGDLSYFQQAKQPARSVVERGREGDVYSLVLLSSPSRAVVASPLFRKEDFLPILDSLTQPDGAGDMASCLNEIDRVLAKAHETLPQIRRRELHFLTDLGRYTWQGAADGKTDPLAEFQTRAQRWGPETTVAVVDVGVGDVENTAVVDLAADEPFGVVGLPTSVRAVVHHYGRNARPGVTATLYLDRRKIDEKTLNLEPGSETTVVFETSAASVPRESGSRVYEVELAPDRLAADDRRRLVLEIKQHLRVLVVHEPALSDEAEFGLENLATALRLKPGADAVGSSPIQVDLDTETDLRDRDLREYDCLVSLDVRRFATSTLRRLHDYLRDGGGLIFFLGPRTDVEHFNTDVAAGELRLSPARIGPVQTEPQYRLNPLKYEHPLLAEFRGREQGGLLNTPVYRHYRLDATAAPKARRVLEFLNPEKDIFLVEEALGAGRSLVVPTSLESAWTTLALSPGFVPLVQEMLSYAVGGRATRTALVVGAPLGGVFRRTTASANVTIDAPSSEAPPLQSATPDGAAKKPPAAKPTAEVAPQGENYRWSFADTSRCGIYTAHISGPPATLERFAVNVDPGESDLVRMSPNLLTERTWSNVRFAYGTEVRDFSDAAASQMTVTETNPLHHWLLVGALCAALVETWWAGRIGRRRL